MDPTPSKESRSSEGSVQPAYLLCADLIHLGVASLLLSSLLLISTDVSILLWIVAALLLAWIMARGWAWAVLAAILVVIMAREPPGAAELDWNSATYAWLCLALVAYSAGFPTVRREIRCWLGSVLQLLLSRSSDNTTHPTLERPSSAGIDEVREVDAGQQAAQALVSSSITLALRAARLMALVLLSMIAFVQLPITPGGRGLWWQRSVRLEMIFWPGPLVFLLAAGGLILLSIAAWRTMTARQADLFLRSQAVQHYFRDVRSILNRLAKIKVR